MKEIPLHIAENLKGVIIELMLQGFSSDEIREIVNEILNQRRSSNGVAEEL